MIRLCVRCFSSISASYAYKNDHVMNILKNRIILSGPVSIADYMKIVLTSQSGYYMTKDVFGKNGDFITSPEVSQLFGEMLGVWSVNELMKLKSPRPLQLVELGPGRGSMIHDIVRVFSKLGETKDVSLHLVEVSPALSKFQSDKLCTSSIEVKDKSFYRQGTTIFGIPVFWYRSVIDLPNDGFTCLFANEFFDALPIHKFQKTDHGWREVLIDVDPTLNSSQLRFVLAKNPTPASVFLTKVSEERDHLEICPQATVIMEHLAEKFEQYGGMALIVDYGHSGEKADTFRAFKNHKLHDPLTDPGTADLTADVNFSSLKEAVKDKLVAFGPVTQADFLQKLHIAARLEILLKNCNTEKEKEIVMSSYNMLTSNEQMGERFKVMALFPAVLSQFSHFTVEGF